MHVMTSVGWMGAVGVFLSLAIAGLGSDDHATVRSSYVAMDTATRYVIVPLAIAAVVTGVVQSLGTTWGLVRHYWVVLKLVISVLAAVVLLLQVSTISRLADSARGRLGAEQLQGDRASMVLHAGVGLVVLTVPMALSIFKPRGVTPLGRKKEPVAAAV